MRATPADHRPPVLITFFCLIDFEIAEALGQGHETMVCPVKSSDFTIARTFAVFVRALRRKYKCSYCKG